LSFFCYFFVIFLLFFCYFFVIFLSFFVIFLSFFCHFFVIFYHFFVIFFFSFFTSHLPSGITVNQIEDRTYAFITLEQYGGVIMYDVTSKVTASFIDFINPRNFTTIEPEYVGGLGPIGMCGGV
jgi:hypothetical protein